MQHPTFYKIIGMLTLGLALSAAGDDPLADRVAGSPTNCVSAFDTSASVEIVDEHTIVYSRTAKRSWVVHPQGTCAGLQPGRTLVVETRGSHLCRGDRFRTIQSTSLVPSGYCRFGAFIPYEVKASTPVAAAQ